MTLKEHAEEFDIDFYYWNMYCALVGAQVVCVLTEGVMPKKVSIKIPECGHGHIVTTVDGSPWGKVLVTPESVVKTAGSVVKIAKKLSRGGEPIAEVSNCDKCIATGKPTGTRPYVPPESRSQFNFAPKPVPEPGYYQKPVAAERPRRPHYLHRP